jgi:uncharacterized protein (UPF0333 family)
MIDLTPGQGSALSGLFTSLGAILAIIIAGKYLSGKVKTLSEALDRSKAMMETHSDYVRETLSKVTDEVNVLKDAMSSLGEQSARIESNTIESSATQIPESVEKHNVVAWEEIRSAWFEARDRLESIANSENLDGRRRAAYGRIDRRSYYDLIERMERENELTVYEAGLFRSAVEIWHKYKNGRKAVDPQDLRKLKAFGQVPQPT